MNQNNTCSGNIVCVCECVNLILFLFYSYSYLDIIYDNQLTLYTDSAGSNRMVLSIVLILYLTKPGDSMLLLIIHGSSICMNMK